MSETDLADVHADIDCWIDEAKADFIADMRVALMADFTYNVKSERPEM